MPRPGPFGFPSLTIFPNPGETLEPQKVLGKVVCAVEWYAAPTPILCPFCGEALRTYQFPQGPPPARSVARIIYLDDESNVAYAGPMPAGTYPLSCGTCGFDFSIADGEGAPWREM